MKILTFVLLPIFLASSTFANSLEDNCARSLSGLRISSLTLTAKLRLQHEPLAAEIRLLEKKEGIPLRDQYYLKKDIQRFLSNLRKTLKHQPDDGVHGLMQVWIENQVQKVGYLPGFSDISPGYRNIEELDRDLTNHNFWPFMNTYSNSVVVLEILSHTKQIQLVDQKSLQLVSIALPHIYDALLIREYALRFVLPKGDESNPQGTSTVHESFARIENWLSELFSGK